MVPKTTATTVGVSSIDSAWTPSAVTAVWNDAYFDVDVAFFRRIFVVEAINLVAATYTLYLSYSLSQGAQDLWEVRLRQTRPNGLAVLIITTLTANHQNARFLTSQMGQACLNLTFHSSYAPRLNQPKLATFSNLYYPPSSYLKLRLWRLRRFTKTIVSGLSDNICPGNDCSVAFQNTNVESWA